MKGALRQAQGARMPIPFRPIPFVLSLSKHVRSKGCVR